MFNSGLFRKLCEEYYNNNHTQKKDHKYKTNGYSIVSESLLVSKALVRAWAVGESEPTFKNTVNICRLFGIDNIEDLVA
jgi:hypothetical protein